MKQICFILDWYPTETNNGCVFAKHLIWAIADKGFECVVIAPRIKNIKTDYVPYERFDITEKGNHIRVFMPIYIHMGSSKFLMKFSMDNHYKTVMRTIKKERIKPDVVYGHFIYQCGLTASRVGNALKIPSYCACGENSLRLEKNSEPYVTGLKFCGWNKYLNSLSGIISVSSNNQTLLLKNNFVDSTMKMDVFPNGYNKNKFYVIDKANARRQLYFPQNVFIVAFTGTFKESKGVSELCEALNRMDDVYSLFMGKGDLQPSCKNILFCGSVPNDKLYLYLNAADVFVLPTKGEGCCNAIIEALGCGLPVVSSDLSFNDDILDDDNSIRVDVNDVDAINNAIQKLKTDDSLLNKLHEGAVRSSDKLDINVRADNILRFMELSK